jgi:hypothetical protein
VKEPELNPQPLADMPGAYFFLQAGVRTVCSSLLCARRSTIVDLANNYSAEYFRYAVGECRKVIAQVVAEDNSSDQQIARVRILRHLDRQLGRAVQWAEAEADLMALVVRGQIELRFWASYVSKADAEAKEFLNEANIDTRQLHEKMMKAYPTEMKPLPDTFPNGKLISLSRIDDDEEVVYKLCSKLIHTTSLILNSPDESILNTGYRQFLAVQALK